MKNFLYTMACVMFFAAVFSSCNKKKLDTLEKELAATQSELNNIKNANNNQANLLQVNNPVIVSVSGNRGFDSVAFNHQSSFNFLLREAYYNNSVYVYPGGSMDFVLWKYANLGDDENYVYISITGYVPSVGIGSANVTVNLRNRYPQADTINILVFSQDGDSYTKNNTVINSLSYNQDTKELSLDITTTDTESNEYNSTNNASTVRFQYTGVVTEQNTIYRKASKE